MAKNFSRTNTWPPSLPRASLIEDLALGSRIWVRLNHCSGMRTDDEFVIVRTIDGERHAESSAPAAFAEVCRVSVRVVLDRRNADPAEITTRVSATVSSVVVPLSVAVDVADAPAMLVVPGGGVRFNVNDPKPAVAGSRHSR